MSAGIAEIPMAVRQHTPVQQTWARQVPTESSICARILDNICLNQIHRARDEMYLLSDELIMSFDEVQMCFHRMATAVRQRSNELRAEGDFAEADALVARFENLRPKCRKDLRRRQIR